MLQNVDTSCLDKLKCWSLDKSHGFGRGSSCLDWFLTDKKKRCLHIGLVIVMIVRRGGA